MTFHVHRGVRVACSPDVYEPAEDSHLLADAVVDLPPGRLVDVGTGTGLVAIHAARAGHDVVATDVEPAACRLARENAGTAGADVDVVRADLVRGLDLSTFDVVACNPPYLPTRDRERLEGPLNAAFDGGSSGVEVAYRLVEQMPGGPELLLVTSSRQDLDRLEQAVTERGRSWEVVRERRVPGFERLAVVRCPSSGPGPSDT